MIRFSFEVPNAESAWRDTWDRAFQVNPEAISEMDLCYKYFGVSVELVVDEVEVISSDGHVTLVDLALSLCHALSRLSAGEDTAIGFTEDDEVIRLRREADLVAITSSKHQWQVSVEQEELVGAFVDFLREAHARLTVNVPGLADNPVVQRFSPEWLDSTPGE
ncbi:hypothetical protein HRW14_15800 [Streptomyces lunaelactis]|uniref:hypothetical protein n=1 Tax=Streptomyces lunaelactis TaxID=1535768 RepID=UPI001585A698|nr:hypothetical protein [Streptomyces lunaelactis]NUK51711.1 hypothetical protein [Streptomyces lunaelactis]NUK67358.1 hypothetical protein [Streptomyces lunaelactis]